MEVNNTFYRLPEIHTFEHWVDATPPDFTFAVKASRYLTHIRRLADSAEPVGRLMDRAAALGPKLGPVLLQLPPSFAADVEALDAALGSFPQGVRLVVEFRHPSWFNDQVRKVLERRGAALCLADRNGRPAGPLWRTAEWGYLRFHSGTASPLPCYGKTALGSWAKRLLQQWSPDDDVYVYFNNDPAGCAVRDAILFASEARRLGLSPTATPDLSQAPVG